MPITPEEFEAVISELYQGLGTVAACKKANISFRRFKESAATNPAWSQMYACALEGRTDLQAEEIIEIADTDPDPQRARNRIDARKWMASKMNPRTYGDKLDLNVNATVDIAAALAEGKQRAALRGRYSETIQDAEIVETKQLSTHSVTGSKPDSTSQPLENRDAAISDPEDIFA